MLKENNSAPPSPRKVLTSAAQFISAANLLERANQTILAGPERTVELHYVIPSVVCRAFSVELLLKCLILIETGKIPHTHELERLYESLSPESQQIIKDRFTASIASNPIIKAMKQHTKGRISVDLIDVLKVTNRVFEEWRYAYEGNVGSVYGLREIIFAVHHRIIKLRPGLASVTIR